MKIARTNHKRAYLKTSGELQAVMGWHKYTEARGKLVSHSHPDSVEMSFMHKGRQMIQNAGKLYQMRGGEYFYSLPGESHGTASKPMEKAEASWLLIPLNTGKESFLNLSPEESADLRKRLISVKRIHFRGRRGSLALWRKLASLMDLDQRRPINAVKLRLAVMDCVLDTLNCARMPEGDLEDNLVNDVLKTIDRNIHRVISLKSLADEYDLSLSRFKARFKEQTGIPPMEYINRQKVEKAKKLLISAASVGEVAYSLGFSSSQYFATVFYKYVRLTPKEFRNQQDVN